MSVVFILAILYGILYTLYRVAHAYLYDKKVNRIINLSLFLSLLFLPDSIASIIFAILVLRLLGWLFGPAQDMIDDYYYERFERARRNYYRRRK